MNVELKPEPVFSGERLVVEDAGPHYMLAMKLLSGRDSDEDDCVMLIREVQMYDPKDLLDFIESAAHPRQLRPRDAFWVLERLDEAKKGRRLRRIRQRFKRSLRTEYGLGSVNSLSTRSAPCPHEVRRIHTKCAASTRSACRDGGGCRSRR